MIYWRLLEITIITVIIVDISGIVTDLKKMIGRILGIQNVSLKPLGCSFCMTFWMSMCYLVYLGELNLTTIMFTLIMSTLTPVIGDLIYMIRDIFGKIILKINDLIK